MVGNHEVPNLWDSGAISQSNGYRNVLDEADGEDGLIYHTARTPPTDRSVTAKGRTMTFPVGGWVQFNELDEVQLDADSSFTILHTEGTYSTR